MKNIIFGIFVDSLKIVCSFAKIHLVIPPETEQAAATTSQQQYKKKNSSLPEIKVDLDCPDHRSPGSPRTASSSLNPRQPAITLIRRLPISFFTRIRRLPISFFTLIHRLPISFFHPDPPSPEQLLLRSTVSRPASSPVRRLPISFVS